LIEFGADKVATVPLGITKVLEPAQLAPPAGVTAGAAQERLKARAIVGALGFPAIIAPRRTSAFGQSTPNRCRIRQVSVIQAPARV
jgi:hypothetical protein